jgi:hypothetical protein
LLARITPNAPVDLDGKIIKAAKAPPLRGAFPAPAKDTTAPAATLWDWPEDPPACLGVRVSEPIENPTDVARKLASAAIERQVTPIILTTLADCGLARFGFRIERLSGDPEEIALYEEELKSFWNLAIVIDVIDVVRLG